MRLIRLFFFINPIKKSLLPNISILHTIQQYLVFGTFLLVKEFPIKYDVVFAYCLVVPNEVTKVTILFPVY